MNIPHNNENSETKDLGSFFKIKRETFELIRFVMIAAIIIIPFRIFIAQPFIVNGASMDPTFETNQYLIVDQLTYRTHEPRRGDVVIFRFPLNPKDFYIKRIIGLPNESVAIRGSDIYIQEKDSKDFYKIDEPYLEFQSSNTMTISLGENEYFVMGDNRPNSSDSRHWGVLPKEFIVGRAYLRLLPFSQIDFLPGQHYQKITDEKL